MKRSTIRTRGSTAFERSYSTALGESVKTAKGTGAGGRIGRRAQSLGIETLALARIHDRAVAMDGFTPASTTRLDSFFAQAVAPIEERHCGAAEALAESTRLGLLVMRERVEMVGGAFSIESSKGRGTTVRAEIPLEGAARE